MNNIAKIVWVFVVFILGASKLRFLSKPELNMN